MTFDGEAITPADDDDGALGMVEGDTPRDDPERRELVDAFGGFLMELAQMSRTSREAVFGLLARRTLAVIAKDSGISIQAVQQAQRFALRKLPVLRVLLSRGNRR